MVKDIGFSLVNCHPFCALIGGQRPHGAWSCLYMVRGVPSIGATLVLDVTINNEGSTNTSNTTPPPPRSTLPYPLS